MHSGPRVLLTAAAVMGIAFPCGVAGQVPTKIENARESVSALASGERAAVGRGRAIITAGLAENYARYSPEDRRLLVDGLIRVGRGESSGDDAARTRAVTAALGAMLTVATDSFVTPEDEEIVRGFVAIYRDSDRLEARALAVSLMGRIFPKYPTQQRDIVGILEAVATSEAEPGEVHPQTAIDALLDAGERGIPILRRIHDGGAVKDPGVAVYLRELVRRGFRR